MFGSIAIPLLLLPLALITPPADGEPSLRQVHAFTRHGEREVLHKVNVGTVEKTPAVLTEQGYARLADMGKRIRERYGSLHFSENYAVLHEQVRVLSSETDRTTSSAEAFLAGMFPTVKPYQLPPVYSLPSQYDNLLRYYDKCPKYNDRVLARQQLLEWHAQESRTAELRTSLARDLELVNPSLDQMWNIFDRLTIMLQKNDSRFEKFRDVYPEVVRINNWVSDFQMAVAKDVPMAGGLLYEVNRCLEEARVGKTGVVFHLWSGHYPTLVSLAKLLGVKGVDGVPGNGATLVIELWEDVMDSWVAVRYFNTGITLSDPVNETEVELEGCPGRCLFPKYKRLTHPYELLQGEWCKACDVSASALCNNRHDAESGSCTARLELASLVAGCVLGAVIGIAIAGICQRLPRKQPRQMPDRPTMQDQEMVPSASTSP